MWKRGFEIQQNIENRKILQCDTPKVKDIVTRNTIDKLETDLKSSKTKETYTDVKDIINMEG